MFVNDLFEKKKPEPEKPRNFVAKNAKMGGAGAHKDKKKADKQGDAKHKKDLAADLAEGNRGYNHGFASPTAPSLKGRREFDEPDAVNNIEISINGRPWKVFAGKGLDSSPEFFKQKQMVDAMCKRKTAETGKKWSWGVTGAPATNEANLATQDKENRFKAIKQRDQQQDRLTHQAMNNVIDEGVAEGSLNEFATNDDDDDDYDDEEDDFPEMFEAPFTAVINGKKQTGTVIIYPGEVTSAEWHLKDTIYIKTGMDNVYNTSDFITHAAEYIQEIIKLDGRGHNYVKHLKRRGRGVAEGADSEELADEVYAEFERIYPNLARRADERTVHAAIIDVLNYGGDSNPSALAQDVARAVKRDMQQGVAEGMKADELSRYCEKLVAEKGWDAAYKHARFMAAGATDPAWGSVLKYLHAMKDGINEAHDTAAKEIFGNLFHNSIPPGAEKHHVSAVLKAHGLKDTDAKHVLDRVRKMGYTGSRLDKSETDEGRMVKGPGGVPLDRQGRPIVAKAKPLSMRKWLVVHDGSHGEGGKDIIEAPNAETAWETANEYDLNIISITPYRGPAGPTLVDEGVAEGSELKQAKRKYNQAAKDANLDQVGAGKKIDTMKKSLRQKDLGKEQGMAEGETDYQKRRQRERDVDAGKPVKPPPKNPQNDYFARRKKERDLNEEIEIRLIELRMNGYEL